MWIVDSENSRPATVADLQPGQIFSPELGTHGFKITEVYGSRYEGHRTVVSHGYRRQMARSRVVYVLHRP